MRHERDKARYGTLFTHASYILGVTELRKNEDRSSTSKRRQFDISWALNYREYKERSYTKTAYSGKLDNH